MGIDVTSLKVLVYIDEAEVSPRDLTSRQLEEIAREVEKLWPPNEAYGIWFDVQTLKLTNNYWEISLIIVCYNMPNNRVRAVIPEHYLHNMLDRKIRIFPKLPDTADESFHPNPMDFGIHTVEVMFVLE